MTLTNLLVAAAIGGALLAAPAEERSQPAAFDHEYQAYGQLLRGAVHGARVDYRWLVARKDALGRVVASFGEAGIEGWTRDQRLAFWINAYNVFTLQAIVEAYPIQGSFFSRAPANSIRQIDGVWTRARWRAAGRSVSLDDIEHKILRPEFHEPRIHFAINCASVGCPPLAAEPYVAAALDAQLDAAGRAYLESPLGVQVEGDTVQVTSILKWYGDDFVAAFASKGPRGTVGKDRATLAVVAAYGTPAAAAVARSGRARLAYLDYDWSLNDVPADGASSRP